MSLHSTINFRRAVFCCKVALLKKKLQNATTLQQQQQNNTLTRLPSAELID